MTEAAGRKAVLEGRITVDALTEVRKMSRPMAASYLNQFLHLTEAEREDILDKMVQDEYKPGLNYEVDRQKMFVEQRHRRAMLYLLGGSYRQIARLERIRPQTVGATLDAVLGPGRSDGRLQSSASEGAVEAWQHMHHKNAPMLLELSPAEAAKWVLQNTDLD